MAEELNNTLENISEAKQVRMQKLAGLVAAGNDPFTEVKYDQGECGRAGRHGGLHRGTSRLPSYHG